ncbi:MAG: adenine deaminase, partial [Bacteroidales bacterium]|nr:adenine deaminase [Bacteroidales bacterium]
NSMINSVFESSDFHFHGESGLFRIIVAKDESLITGQEQELLEADGGVIKTDISRDILKIAVVNRYHYCKPAIGWIKNFGLKHGAIASSVAHDSHNIVVVGVDDESIARAVNSIITAKGGISVINNEKQYLLLLPVAGLMSTKTVEEVAAGYEKLSNKAKEMNCELQAPFMTLSFMALLVIPELKLGDRGLFDVKQFKFVEAKL